MPRFKEHEIGSEDEFFDKGTKSPQVNAAGRFKQRKAKFDPMAGNATTVSEPTPSPAQAPSPAQPPAYDQYNINNNSQHNKQPGSTQIPPGAQPDASPATQTASAVSGPNQNQKSIESYEGVQESQADYKDLVLKLNTDLIGSVKQILNVFSTDEQIKPIIKAKQMKEVKGLISSAKNAQGMKGQVDMIKESINSSQNDSDNSSKNNKLEEKISELNKTVSFLVNKLSKSESNSEKQKENNIEDNFRKTNDVYGSFNFKSVNDNVSMLKPKVASMDRGQVPPMVTDEFMDKIKNIEEDVERNQKGPMSFKELSELNNVNDPNKNLNELKKLLN